jgi:hypothetical protein
MRDGQRGRTDIFSAVIVVLCLGAGTVLFFTSTAPAAREHRWLQGVERDRMRLRDELSRQLIDLRTRQAALTWDPQTILLAIDAAKLTPGELLGEVVPGMPAVPAWSTDERR